MLDLKIRKIHGTTFKLVFSGEVIIGIFDRGQFFSTKGMTEFHKKAFDKWHVETFHERVKEYQYG